MTEPLDLTAIREYVDRMKKGGSIHQIDQAEMELERRAHHDLPALLDLCERQQAEIERRRDALKTIVNAITIDPRDRDSDEWGVGSLTVGHIRRALEALKETP